MLVCVADRVAGRRGCRQPSGGPDAPGPGACPQKRGAARGWPHGLAGRTGRAWLRCRVRVAGARPRSNAQPRVMQPAFIGAKLTLAIPRRCPQSPRSPASSPRPRRPGAGTALVRRRPHSRRPGPQPDSPTRNSARAPTTPRQWLTRSSQAKRERKVLEKAKNIMRTYTWPIPDT